MKYSIAFAITLLASALNYASAACSCKPTSIEFKLKLSNTCNSSTIVTGDGFGPIGNVTCFSYIDEGVEDDVPVEINGYSIDQYDSNEMFSEPVSYEENLEVNYKDGDTLTLTFAETSNPVTRVNLSLYGKNAEGFSTIQFAAIGFTNDCMAYPVLQKGDTLGWLEVKSFGEISDDYSCICQDNPGFVVGSNEANNCDWVAEKPSSRCSADWDTFFECPTVCHPQCSSSTNECVDDPDATITIDGKKKTCGWVAKKAGKRCKEGGAKAFSKCAATCNPFCNLKCSDSKGYFMKGDETKDCEWVSKEPEKRCGKDNGKPFKKCSATCNPGCQAFPQLEFDV